MANSLKPTKAHVATVHLLNAGKSYEEILMLVRNATLPDIEATQTAIANGEDLLEGLAENEKRVELLQPLRCGGCGSRVVALPCLTCVVNQNRGA